MSKIVAVTLKPVPHGRIRETEFHKADEYQVSKSGQTIRILRGGKEVATYDRAAVRGIRYSTRPFNNSKVTFVRRFVPGYVEPTFVGDLIESPGFDRSNLGIDAASPGQ